MVKECFDEDNENYLESKKRWNIEAQKAKTKASDWINKYDPNASKAIKDAFVIGYRYGTHSLIDDTNNYISKKLRALKRLTLFVAKKDKELMFKKIELDSLKHEIFKELKEIQLQRTQLNKEIYVTRRVKKALHNKFAIKQLES